MAIEGVNNTPYSTPEQTKYTSKAAEIAAQQMSVTDTTNTVIGTDGNSANTNDNPADAKKHGKHIKSVVDQMNQQIRNKRTRCEFKYYEETNRVAIKVIDRDTDEIVREIPPEKTLEMVEKMWELAGLLVDEKR